MKSKKSLWIALAVVAVVVIAAVGWIMSTYNGLVETREQVTAQQANVQSQLQRRADLIPNLVSTVQAYATHEEEVYTALADARAALAGASTVDELNAANSALDSALSRLLVVVENYPELQASEIENVEFTGGVADPFPYYKKAKMVLLMTTMEGYGMVLVEGQRTGAVPVAYPSSSGVLSIIENGGGVAVPEMSAKSLAKTVYALAKDENRMRALVRSSYKKSEQNLISNIDSKWRQLLK